MNSLPNREHVCMLVQNAVYHDTRVLKEASTLQKAGLAVTVIGIQDARTPPENCQKILPNGVEVFLISFQKKRCLQLRNFHCRLQFGLALLFVLALTLTIIAFSYAPQPLPGIGVLIACLFLHARKRCLKLLSQTPPLKQMVALSQRLYQMATYQRFLHNEFIQELIPRRPKVVHCHDAQSLPAGCRYKKRHPCILVYDSHELAENQHGSLWLNRMRVKWWQWLGSRHVQGFITINESIAGVLQERYPKLPPAVILKNATLPSAAQAPYDGRLHRAAGIPPEKKILLFQGGFANGRGLLLLIEAVKTLPDPWVLVFMGHGYLEGHLKEVVSRLDKHIAQRVRFIPSVPQEELELWTAGATVGAILYENICLNHYYCTPNKLWEYPRSGVPILATHLPEIAKVVLPNDTGWLLKPPVTPEAISEQLAQISEFELNQKKEKCARFIRQDNWGMYAPRLTALYQQLLGIEETPFRTENFCHDGRTQNSDAA